ncbi:MAG TPA: ATP-dependent metallopeptidase FtsH/Yme1/Tma family protein [Caldithrix abyssi]|uniref:ATP-dependent zinc metalloprotease FtsH n=1 Tax=Caldithrix abyssi TaxID=187145 RepID=A0A7V4WV86_CALAY|nr:ATP-dependent metallopeptidase FtsH/Yme1/Tma family protein [Caldithrix abyssi]
MKKETKFSIWYYIALFIGLMLLQIIFFPGTGARKEISYNTFREKVREGKVAKLVILPDRYIGEYKTGDTDTTSSHIKAVPSAPWRLHFEEVEKRMARQFSVTRLPNMPDENLIALLDSAGVDYSGRIESNFLENFFINWILPIGFMILIWGFIFRRMNMTGKNMMTFGTSKAKIQVESDKNRVTFKDVAGVDEAVEEVKELVDFLKNPQHYTSLGGKLPKGVLLVGPPGTGKTLLARAVAGEADVPFFSLSGSDFVEMFVGVGAARVRDLFKQAKEKAPCIIFIDEIDAIGKSRGKVAAMGGGYDERENTLNQLLVEMDGFDPGAGVIIMGATNRPEVLDPALLRPGRFDRQVLVDRPDMKGRAAIFKVHTRQIVLDNDVELDRLAAQTPGFAGAEIANVCNEAALLAARKKKKKVSMREFEEAIERIIAGLEKKNKLINEKERKIVAYHESGHAIVGYFTPGAESVQKVSIVPRGIGALGYTLQMPLEDRYLMSKAELIGKIKGLLGGRAAEEIVFGEISTGASNDLEKVAQIARNMIVVYGMSERMPNLSLVQQSGPGFLGQGPAAERRSEKLEQMIDDEVLEIISTCYKETKDLLTKKRALLDAMANKLLQQEVLDYHEIRELLGDSNSDKKKSTDH